LCEEYVNHEPTLLVLGDQIYKSNTSVSCTKQFLNHYSQNDKLSVSVTEVPLSEVNHYGILSGKIEQNMNYFDVDKMVEKPDIDLAEAECYTKYRNTKKYFAVFGEYILTDEVFKVLRRNIKNEKREKGEFQITSVLEEVRSKNGMTAFIPDGKMYDVGIPLAYKETFVEMSKK